MGSALERMRRYQNDIIGEFWPNAELCAGSVAHPEYVVPVKKYKFPDNLYHYTSIDAAAAIIGNRDDHCGFAFTHYGFLNDREEYDKGLEIALDWIDRRGGELFRWCRSGGKLSSCIEEHTNEQSCIPYVLSFTTEKDSLSQWMSYTDKCLGGLAIGCERSAIEKVIEEIDGGALGDENLSDIIFAPCIYCDRSEGMNERYEKILDSVFSGCSYAWNKESREEFVKWVAGRVFQFAALVKNKDFYQEHEWRMVLRPKNVDHMSGVRFIGGKPRLKPQFINLKSCVNELIVSPHGEKRRAMFAAKVLKAMTGCQVSICESELSYCGG